MMTGKEKGGETRCSVIILVVKDIKVILNATKAQRAAWGMLVVSIRIADIAEMNPKKAYWYVSTVEIGRCRKWQQKRILKKD